MEAVVVRELLEHPGSSRRLLVEDSLDEDLSTELARVEAGEPIRADLLLESVVEGIYVTGPVSGRMALSCARCLRGFHREYRVEVAELFGHRPEDEEDQYPLEDDAIDLEPMIRDAVGLTMPFSPLCRPDCAGLCERCGGDRNLGECSCPPRVDPRWAALEHLRLD